MFTLSSVMHGAAVTVRLSGHVDMDVTPLLQSMLGRALLGRTHSALTVDLSGLTSIDSFALSVLLAAHRHALDTGGRMIVTGMSASIRGLIVQRGLHTVLEIRATDLAPITGVTR